MKNLNAYGEKAIEKIKAEGKLSDINDLYQVDYVSVRKGQTSHLIDVTVVLHSEEIYIYNNKKYKLDVYQEFVCNELFTISFNTKNKEDLINNFVEGMYTNIFDYVVLDITEDEYNSCSDISKIEILNKLKTAIL